MWMFTAWRLVAGSRLGRAVAVAVAALAAVLAYGASKKRKGRQAAENEALKNNAERQEKGRDAVSEIRGAGRDDLIDRVRDNEGRWD